MDSWILKQLRGQVLTDLGNLVPENHFDADVPWTRINGLSESKHLSYEVKWGYLASTLGQELYFRPTKLMSARQVSAAEMLMHLGMLATAEAAQSSCLELSSLAAKLNAPDGNSGAVAEQLRSEGVPTLINNVRLGLEQYLKYLQKDEAEPFLPLLKRQRKGAANFL